MKTTVIITAIHIDRRANFGTAMDVAALIASRHPARETRSAGSMK